MRSAALTAVRGAALLAIVLLTGSCGPLSSTQQTSSLGDIALQPGEVPSGFNHCGAISGAYPTISSAYNSPDEDAQAWNRAAADGATEGWVEIYQARGDWMRDNFDPCSLWSAANNPAASNGYFQNVLIKFKDQASAQQAFTRGDFVPQQKADYLSASTAFIGGEPTVKGDQTGLGPNSYAEHGTFMNNTFYNAYWRRGQYVATILANHLATPDDGSKGASAVDSRIPREAPAGSPLASGSSVAASSAQCSVPSTGTGVISGALQYPGSAIPPMKVYAVSTCNPHAFRVISTGEGQTAYRLTGLPPGTYHVLSYYQALAGGYTKYVACGMLPSCTDHSLVTVTVQNGQTVSHVDPVDFYGWNGPSPPEPS